MEEYLDGKDNPFFSFMDEFQNFFASSSYTSGVSIKLRFPNALGEEPVPLRQI
jgi:hypothetical protein